MCRRGTAAAAAHCDRRRGKQLLWFERGLGWGCDVLTDKSGDSAELRWDDFALPERVSVVSIMALPCFVFLRILFIFITTISVYSSQWLPLWRIHKLPLILKNRRTKMRFLSIYFGAGGHFLGAVDTNKLKCERTVLKGEGGGVCVHYSCSLLFPCSIPGREWWKSPSWNAAASFWPRYIAAQKKKTHSSTFGEFSLQSLRAEV